MCLRSRAERVRTQLALVKGVTIIARILGRLRDVRFTPESGHRGSAN